MTDIIIRKDSKTLKLSTVGVSTGTSQFTQSAETDEATVVGNAVYVKPSNGHVALSQANAQPAAQCAGLAIEAKAPTLAVLFVSQGKVSIADWTAIIGAASLAAGAAYYVDPSTPGLLTATPPSGIGEFVVRIGRAMSSTLMDVNVEPPMLL